MKTMDGAFPQSGTISSGVSGGLSKREYIAAMAMQGLLSNPSSNHHNLMGVNTSESPGWISSGELARESIRHADELLKQLDR